MVAGSDAKPIISLRDVSTPPSDAYYSPVRKVNFVVEEGALVIIKVEGGHQNSPFSSLAQGILRPGEGMVEFRGRPWSALTDSEVVQARGTMGRVFDEHAWISNISTLDNILLAGRYHSPDTDQMLLAEALQWCRRFGYSEIPFGRPTSVQPERLKVCQWIRACMQSPRLLLLEHPERNVSPNAVTLLAGAMDDLRQTGAGVMWVTERGVPPTAAGLSPPKVYTKRGDELVAENDP